MMRMIKVFVTQLCLTLCDPVDCSPPGSSVCGIFQAKILEWVAIEPGSPVLQTDYLPSEPKVSEWGVLISNVLFDFCNFLP